MGGEVGKWFWESSLMREHRERMAGIVMEAAEHKATAELNQLLYEKAMADLRLTLDLLAGKTLEVETLKNKLVDRPATPAILKAKSSAEVRRVIEQENDREEANGLQ